MCELIVFGWPYGVWHQNVSAPPANYSANVSLGSLGSLVSVRIIITIIIAYIVKAHLLNLQIENFRSVISKSKVYGCEFDSIMF